MIFQSEATKKPLPVLQLQGKNMELRFSKASYSEGKASGVAAFWNTASYIPQIGKHEQFSQNCFKFPKQGVPVFLQHDKTNPLANSASGTCKLRQTDKGLEYEISLPESAKKERELLSRGDLQGVSIGMHPRRERFENGTRIIDECLLAELSLVCTPAHQTTLSYRFKGVKPRRKWSQTIWRY